MQKLFTFKLNCGFAAAHFWAAISIALALVEIMQVNGAGETEWFQAMGRHLLPEAALAVAVLAVVVAVDRRLGKSSR